jgi:hypothetical protein
LYYALIGVRASVDQAQIDLGVDIHSSAVNWVGCRAWAPRTIQLAACHSCHGGGLLPLRDQVRDIIERVPDYFDPDSIALVRAQYLPAAELDALIERDSAVHRSALARALVPADGPNPLSRVFAEFETEPLTARQAAAELGVRLDQLRENLDRLDPRLAPLGAEGSVERASFSGHEHALPSFGEEQLVDTFERVCAIVAPGTEQVGAGHPHDPRSARAHAAGELDRDAEASSQGPAPAGSGDRQRVTSTGVGGVSAWSRPGLDLAARRHKRRGQVASERAEGRRAVPEP